MLTIGGAVEVALLVYVAYGATKEKGATERLPFQLGFVLGQAIFTVFALLLLGLCAVLVNGLR